jgi:hypothetical protein
LHRICTQENRPIYTITQSRRLSMNFYVKLALNKSHRNAHNAARICMQAFPLFECCFALQTVHILVSRSWKASFCSYESTAATNKEVILSLVRQACVDLEKLHCNKITRMWQFYSLAKRYIGRYKYEGNCLRT